MRMILTVNAGSSSVRLAAFRQEGGKLLRIAGSYHSLDEGTPDELLRKFLGRLGTDRVVAASHRVVHGGKHLVNTCLIGPDEEREIERLSALAPLHNPPALRLIRAARSALGPEVLQVAVFDTALFADMPDVAKTYALPGGLCAEHGIRRYGFHGLAHRAMWLRWRELTPDAKGGGRVISLQLGAGCSMTAFREGKVVDTSMGFSPLEGLVMATRSGDVDPRVITYLQRTIGLSVDKVEELLNKSSGLLGVSGISSDMRKLLDSDKPEARLAVELYCYRARKYVGAYIAALGGADAIIFGGGVGENSPEVRERILSGMQWCGIDLDKAANSAASGKEGRISSGESKVEVWVLPVDEAALLASEAIALMSQP